MAKIIDERLAAKDDIQSLRNDLKSLEEKLLHKITIRFGGMMVGAITILSIILKLGH